MKIEILFFLSFFLLQSNSADAEAYLQKLSRTWGIWIGIGDYETQKFDLVAYRQTDANVYNDVTAPSMTGQPFLDSIAYVDKHPQPSHDGVSGSLPTALSYFYGNISLETTKIITQAHQTGDVQIASYDFAAKQMYVAIGRVNGEGTYLPPGSTDKDAWKAYNRPHVKFDLNDLWNGV